MKTSALAMSVRTLAACVALSAMTTSLPACGTIARLSGSGNALTVSSTNQSRSLQPTFTTAVYLPVDPQTAEVYLTDLPMDRIRDSKDPLTDAQGNILHLHVFLVPSAGDTPIDETACNITLRHAVLAGAPASDNAKRPGPIIGLYSGGGFVLPSGTIGDNSIGGSISGSSHRLVRASASFQDALGSGAITGRFDATRDDQAAKAIAARLESLTRGLKPIEQPTASK